MVKAMVRTRDKAGQGIGDQDAEDPNMEGIWTHSAGTQMVRRVLSRRMTGSHSSLKLYTHPSLRGLHNFSFSS
jgi:hypothetical protein